MKKEIFRAAVLVFTFLFLVSCSSDDDAPDPNPVSIQNDDENIDSFVWRAMNFWYLYKDDVPNLQDSKIDNTNEYRKFLSTYDSPENLFDDLLTKNILQGVQEDRFSRIVNDYIALEQNLSGTSKNNGMEFDLGRIVNTDDIFGFVRYVLPGTDAESKGVSRGDIFTRINGTQLNLDNYRSLLFGLDSYEVEFNVIENGALVPTKNLTLIKTEYTENPIFIAKNIEYGGQKIGYLMYNGFTFGFNKQMNDAFANFKNDGISDLILDLRYNGGGSVYTAVALSSMITGNYTGQIFAKSIYNQDILDIVSNQDNADEFLNDRFLDNIITDFDNNTQEPINSLGLQKIYILTSRSSASASELVINSLSSYIDVIQIGTETSGKFQASRTLYDSGDLNREGANPDHTYALQPLISKISNKDDNTDFINGLTPLVRFSEDFQNMGTLGESNEPFLNTALEYIVNGAALATKKQGTIQFELIGNSKMNSSSYQRMYIDNIPFSTFEEKE
ncbi:hypothetical protein AWE51_21300 [Aquimarina aggregata]|uniref:Tail specific protease domain-containing protein n=1 Tax=Aquimarina aggregata TaxID=1642818 RepID=A0A162FD92_9FLAO|nr:S41 family peptidase [Aquimarina aggregata]KZS41546.1 hypothetical protein AWE51_21300 [Aquimarina aggregata]